MTYTPAACVIEWRPDAEHRWTGWRGPDIIRLVIVRDRIFYPPYSSASCFRFFPRSIHGGWVAVQPVIKLLISRCSFIFNYEYIEAIRTVVSFMESEVQLSSLRHFYDDSLVQKICRLT